MRAVMTQINVVLNVTVSVSIDEHIHRLQTAINGNNDVTTADPPPLLPQTGPLTSKP